LKRKNSISWSENYRFAGKLDDRKPFRQLPFLTCVAHSGKIELGGVTAAAPRRALPHRAKPRPEDKPLGEKGGPPFLTWINDTTSFTWG